MDDLSNQYCQNLILNKEMDDYSEKCYDLLKYTPMNKNSFFKVIIMLFFRSKCSHVLR